MPADSQLALRVLVKERSFTLLAILVLALGIGGVATQTSIISGLLLRGLGFPNGERIMNVNFIDPSQNQNNNFGGGGSAADFVTVRETQKSFEEFAAYLNGSTVNVTYQGKPQRYTGGYVTENFFRTLGVRPIHGSDFTAEDNRQGVEKKVMLSHQIWTNDFSADPGVVGKTIRVNGQAAVIVGVMPEGFNFPVNEQLWVPLFNEFPVRPRGDRQSINPAWLGRLREGVSLDQATAEFTTLSKGLAIEFPATNQNLTAAQVQPFVQSFFGQQFRGLLLLMLLAVVAVLLIACVNVMNMQFARATRRAKEMAIRGALGASRWRLMRQMLVESAVLAGFGAIGGVLIAVWSTGYLYDYARALPQPPPTWVKFTLDWRALAATLVAAGGAAIVSGLIPAWMASRYRTADMLKEGGRGGTGRLVKWLIRIFVILQIGLTAALLIFSLFMVRSIVNQSNIPWGYDTNSVLSARIGLFDADYPTPEVRQVFLDRTLRDLRADPTFTHVALSSRIRMTFPNGSQYEVEGETYKDDKSRPNALQENVTPGYFETLGVKLRDGRDFTEDDSEQKVPVAIVNPAFVRKHFPTQNPIGRRFRLVNGDNTTSPWRTIVGVSPALRMQGPFNGNPQNQEGAGFYMPMNQQTPRFATILVKGRGTPTALTEPLRQAMLRLDANLPIYFVNTPYNLIRETLAQNRLQASMFSIFGGVAVLLAAVGLYGVMSYSVNQQTQEYGIRLALGASAGRIARTILEQGAMQLAIGLTLGLAVAAVAVKLTEGFLRNVTYEVQPFEPTVWLSTIALLTFVTLAACLAPARRAARVHPMVALRYE